MIGQLPYRATIPLMMAVVATTLCSTPVHRRLGELSIPLGETYALRDRRLSGCNKYLV